MAAADSDQPLAGRRQSGQRPKGHEIDQLPHDKECRQVQADHLTESKWCQIQQGPVAKQ